MIHRYDLLIVLVMKMSHIVFYNFLLVWILDRDQREVLI